MFVLLQVSITLLGIHHFCCSDYTPTSAKRKATIDDNDRVAKRRRPEYEEDVAEPDIFGQAVRMKDGRSYGYWSEEKATMLLYKEDGKMSAEVPGAKDVYCVRCAELKPQCKYAAPREGSTQIHLSSLVIFS